MCEDCGVQDAFAADDDLSVELLAGMEALLPASNNLFCRLCCSFDNLKGICAEKVGIDETSIKAYLLSVSTEVALCQACLYILLRNNLVYHSPPPIFA